MYRCTATASDKCTTTPKECIDETGEWSLERGLTPAENCFEGLSLLADSCPIDHLMQKKLQETEEKLHHQTALNQHLNLQLSTLLNQQEVQIEGLSIEKIIQQEKKITGLFFNYTNLKHSTFVSLYNILTEQQMPVFPKKRKDMKTMKPETQLLLTLMRLRHNFGLKDLAARFFISSVSEIFSALIEHMYLILGSIPIWPHRNDIIRNNSKYAIAIQSRIS